MLGKLFKFAGMLVVLGLIIGVISVAVLGTEKITEFIDKFNEDDLYEEMHFVAGEDAVNLELQFVNRNVVVSRGDVETIEIHYFVSERDTITVSENSGTVKMENRVRWQLFGAFRHVSSEIRRIEVVLPVNLLVGVDIKTTNGNLLLEELDNVQGIKLQTTNGNVTLRHISIVDDLIIQTTNGLLNVQYVAADKMNLKTTNGSITVNKAESNHITLKSTNGGITVDVRGVFEEYRIDVKSTNGRIRYENYTLGSGLIHPNATNILNVQTTNGGIRLSFSE